MSGVATSGTSGRDVVGRDVVVVGGGLIGLAVAWQAAGRGLDVHLVDPDPGRGASNVAAGMLAPVMEVTYGEQDHLTLTIAGARAWPAFAAELEATTGMDVGYRATGTLLVGYDADDAAALADLQAFQTELGLSVTRLRGRELRDREPLLSPRVRTGLLAEEDHRVEPRAVVTALLAAARDAGVHLDDGRVARLDHDGQRVSGVTLTDGRRVDAPRVVLAAGAWSATIDGLPDAARPAVRPLKGQLLHLRALDGRQVLTTTVRALVRHRSLYLVPRDDGRLVVGASQEERGFDTTVTAGATRELLDDAAAVLPGIDELELIETIAGLRPTTPDNAPVIGPTAALEGLVLATGHHRNGALLTALTARTVTDILTGSAPDPVLAAADPDRTSLRRHGPTDGHAGDEDDPDDTGTNRTDRGSGLEALLAANRGARPGR
jgi:glycine oxidase